MERNVCPPSPNFVGSRVPIEISFLKIPQNRLETIFVILRNKVLILCDSECLGRVHSVNRNETEQNGIQQTKEVLQAANKSRLFQVFSVPINGLERIFKCFLFQALNRNGIPKFFLFQKGVRNKIPRLLSIPKMVRNGIPRFFLFQKYLGKEFRGFSHPKIVRNRIPKVFLFLEIVRNGIPRFFSSAK